jgi:hypothetical protein
MFIRIKIAMQHRIGETDQFTIERSTNTLGGTAQADALCNAANTALLRAIPNSDYVLAVVKKVKEESQ